MSIAYTSEIAEWPEMEMELLRERKPGPGMEMVVFSTDKGFSEFRDSLRSMQRDAEVEIRHLEIKRYEMWGWNAT